MKANPKLWQMLRKHELALDAIFDYYAHMFPEVQLAAHCLLNVLWLST